MTSIKTTKQSVHMNVPNTEKIDISKIYTRGFFNAFNLQNYRVYFRGEDGSLNESTVNLNHSKDIQFSDVLGEEQTPNGYTNLPLEIEARDTEKSMIEAIAQYVSRFDSSRDDKQVKPLGGIMVSFPLDVEIPIVTIDDLYDTKNIHAQSIYQSSKSTVDYAFVENVLRDLYIQFDYLKQFGMIYTEINADFLYRIQNRFILLDSEHMVSIEDDIRADQEKQAFTSVVKCITNLLGQDMDADFNMKFIEIQDTRVFYVLKRLDLEGVFEWI